MPQPATLDEALESLSDVQKDAVSWTENALLVLAGPGSGKTRVLTTRIARLFEESPEEHFRVLALTFTNRAADEMRERIERMAPQAEDRLFIGTFHAFSADVLLTMRLLHFIAAGGGGLLLIVHAYLGTVAFPGTARGMLWGSVTREWAKLHHALWAREQSSD